MMESSQGVLRLSQLPFAVFNFKVWSGTRSSSLARLEPGTIIIYMYLL